ncbi:MAG TPA: TlpA family protein disulfide reductase, partial [Desulfobacterales bacterium]|nr:TlpA family protein disulfide reductase [Desulfobacterales bacterium]
CPPCLKSIPHYNKLQKKYKDRLAIVAIEVQDMKEKQLKDFVKENGINYTTVSYEKSGDLVPYISARAQWKGAIPFLVILDKKGDVQVVQAGMLPEEALEDVIEKLSK